MNNPVETRINQYLASSGEWSRRKAEELVVDGKVAVNGKIISVLATRVLAGDKVTVAGRIIRPSQTIIYAVNKPKGYVCTTTDRYDKNIITALVPRNPTVKPAGRLDRDSEGLVILTNSGQLIQKLTHPRAGKDKEYEVTVGTGQRQSNEAFAKLRQAFRAGVEIEKERTKPVEIKETGRGKSFIKVNLVLREGKKRQIRLTVSSVGLTVIALRRVRIGKLVLGNLPPGKYKKISERDL